MSDSFPRDRNTVRLARLQLTIVIGDVATVYNVMPLRPESGAADRAWRLTKAAGSGSPEPYDISDHGGFIRCTCGDAVWRREDGSLCKHAQACVGAGLL